MELAPTKNTKTEKLILPIKLYDIETLKIINKSEKLLTKITEKEILFIEQVSSKKSKKNETFNALIHLRGKLNKKLKFLATNIHNMQLLDMIRYQHQVHQEIKNTSELKKELKLCVQEHRHLIKSCLTMIKESEQAQQLAEHGLRINENTPLFPESDAEYELLKHESNGFFLDIENTHQNYIETLIATALVLIDEQDELLSTKVSLIKEEQQNKTFFHLYFIFTTRLSGSSA